MVWCGVVWCGVVWCGVVWCGVVWCGEARWRMVYGVADTSLINTFALCIQLNKQDIISFIGSQSLVVYFDKRSATAGEIDLVRVTAPAGKAVSYFILSCNYSNRFEHFSRQGQRKCDKHYRQYTTPVATSTSATTSTSASTSSGGTVETVVLDKVITISLSHPPRCMTTKSLDCGHWSPSP